jgi:hypothetical protein
VAAFFLTLTHWEEPDDPRSHGRADSGITKEIRDEPWDMREFGLRTVDGHRLMVGHELPGA